MQNLDESTWGDDYEEVSALDISAFQEETRTPRTARQRRLNKRNPHHRKQLDKMDSDEEISMILDPHGDNKDDNQGHTLPGEFKTVLYSDEEEENQEKTPKKKYKRKEVAEDDDGGIDGFFDPKWEEKIQKYCQVEGKLRVKAEIEALIGKIEWDYFQFCAEGRILAGWNNKPKGITEKPKYAIFCRNIRKVVSTYKGKRGHFQLDSTYAKDLLMICMREAESQMWCEALNWFKLYWSSQPKKDYEQQEEGGYTIDPRVVAEVMIDREKTEPDKIKELLNYEEVQKAKKMFKVLEKCGHETLMNRMAHGYVKKCSGQQMDADVMGEGPPPGDNAEGQNKEKGNDMITFGNKIVVPKAGGFSGRKYAILVTAKDTDYEDDDDEIIEKNKLPPWMDLETMYVFPYEDKDNKEMYEQKICTKEMLSIEFQDDSASKDGYTFRVETRNKIFFYNCRSAHECKQWVIVLNKSKKTIEEMGRTK